MKIAKIGKQIFKIRELLTLVAPNFGDIDARKLRRLLQRNDEKLAASGSADRLLFRSGGAGNSHLYADLAMVLRHLPGLIRNDFEEPCAATLKIVESIHDQLRYMQDHLKEIHGAVFPEDEKGPR